MRQAPQNLAIVQDGLKVLEVARITSQMLAKDAAPTVSHKGQVRLAIEVAAALALVSLFLIAGIDSILRTRRRQRVGVEIDQVGDVVGPDPAAGEERLPEVAVRVPEAPASPPAAERTTPSVVSPVEPAAAPPTATGETAGNRRRGRCRRGRGGRRAGGRRGRTDGRRD